MNSSVAVNTDSVRAAASSGGGLSVIRERDRVFNLLSAKLATKSLHAAALLRLPDILCEAPLSVSEVAARTGLNHDALYRLLRALASLGFFFEDSLGRFSTTEVGLLIADRPNSLRPLLLWMNDFRHDLLWSGLVHAVQTGEAVAEHVVGQPFWDYLDSQPDLLSAFNECMAATARRMHYAAISAYPFGKRGTVVDVGGGSGALLQSILEKEPGLSGILYERASVVAGAIERLASVGLAGRCKVVQGDFFSHVPPGDVFVMSHILHDWQDDECVQLLKNCRSSSPPGGRVVIVEMPVSPANKECFAKLLDIEMLVLAGGRERTVEEYQSLLLQAGFTPGEVYKTKGPAVVIEGRAAD